MRRRFWLAAWVVALLGGGRLHAEPSCCPPPGDCFLERLAPVGGCNPYGDGWLHWWPKCCFPCESGPDDYCRKPLPKVCWPPYPPYYIYGPPEVSHPRGGCGRVDGYARSTFWTPSWDRTATPAAGETSRSK